MGMTLVLSLTQQIDGKISLERAGGTRFTVDFPA
jgi:two-component sensor histidine kinase